MKTTLYTLCALLALSLAGFAWAAGDTYKFDNEVDRKRFRAFTEEMRCPKCQNQNLAGSDSPIAEDLRREIYLQIQDGRSDREIVDFMVDRYGDYVLYRPPLSVKTLGLWLGPLVLLLIGIAILIWVVVRRRTRVGETRAEVHELSAAERARLDAMLKSDSTDSNDHKKPSE